MIPFKQFTMYEESETTARKLSSKAKVEVLKLLLGEQTNVPLV